MNQTLMIFAKNAIYGEVKTRLAATMGKEVALSVYRQLLQHTATITQPLPVQKMVFYSSYIEKQDVWSNLHYQKRLQSGNDLGSRMKKAFALAFNEGCERVVIIGTDCFELTSAIIMEAFAHLDHVDMVIGPAKDGGYYLLGMKQLHASLFHNINWSTSLVFMQTVEKGSALNLSYFRLPELSDIDDEQDVIREARLSSTIPND